MLALSLALNLFGVTATLPSSSMWCNDTIAGENTIAQRPRLFSTWVNKYPRVHFLVNSAVYEPLVRYWDSHPVQTTDAQGNAVPVLLDLRRMSILSLVAFVITALMGTGTVAAVFFSARATRCPPVSAAR